MERFAFESLRMVVNTQTPLIRFREGSLRAQDASELSDLVEGEDYKWTTGGVTRMLVPLLRAWQKEGLVGAVEWVAMGADEGERRLRDGGIDLSFVGLSPEEKAGYATVKERMWALLNSNPSTATPWGEGGIAEEAWLAFDAYQDKSAEALRRAGERLGGLDLLYVHDFQQIGVASSWTGADVAKVFHLHTPFPSRLPEGWARYFVGHLSRYDAIVVSTRRYAENLRAAGLRAPIHVVHPFIDPRSFRAASPADVARFRARFDIAPRERVVLNVGRMDPMKGQDRLLRAFALFAAEVPDARLVLVGNGSFSSSSKGGLGLDKGPDWRAHLERLAADLGLVGRVTFTGHLGDDLLPAAYETSDVFALPSTREGFGLAAIEAWRYRKPIVVSARAGVSELVVNGANGESLDAADADALAQALRALLDDPRRARRLGEMGYETSDVATLDVGRKGIERVFATAAEARARVAV